MVGLWSPKPPTGVRFPPPVHKVVVVSNPASRERLDDSLYPCHKMYYVYIVKDNKGKIYIGYSSNLRRRIVEHKSGRVYSTSKMLDPELFYYEAYSLEDLARKREAKLKKFGSSYKGLIKRIGVK